MNDSEKIILEKIKNLRNQKGFSQLKLAHEIGISQTGYAKMERGDTDSIPLSVAVGIAKTLNVGFNELFDIDGDSQKIDSLFKVIEALKEKNEELNKIIIDKSLLIETLLNEKAHIKYRLLINLVGDFFSDLTILGDKISKSYNEEEKEKLNEERLLTVCEFESNKDYYLKTGVLSQLDFDNFYKETRHLYRNLPNDDYPRIEK